MKTMEAISIRLANLMKEKGLTGYGLWKLSGVSEATISDLRLMRNNSVGRNVIQALADGMGMGLDEFFADPLFSRENITD